MTWSFRDLPLTEAFDHIVDIGFSSVELWNGHLDPLKATDAEVASWKKKFDDAGVRITSYYVDFPASAGNEQIGRCFAAARRLGVDVLSSTLPKAAIPRIDQACQKFKMYVGLHDEVYPYPDPAQIEVPTDYVKVFREFSKWMGATLDVGHLYAAGYDPVKFIQEHHDRIVSLHLKDENRSRHYTDFPFGQGATPLVPILHALQKVRYQRAANIEWGVEKVDSTRGVAEALAYVKRALA